MTTFGEQLREWRTIAGLTQQALADACGIDFTYVSKIESGASNAPSVDTLHKMADACGVHRMLMCRAAKRFPKPITRAELEAQWWLQYDTIKAYDQYIGDRGLNKDYAMYEALAPASDGE
jgi:transcriptional regulator with XRE-family HTH domain